MTTITGWTCRDIRFPTSKHADGSDAMNPDTDYSAAYVVLETDRAGLQGHGLTFTLGKGTELCVAAVNALAPSLVGKNLEDITRHMGAWWQRFANPDQLRWVGPEKGVLHLAVAALVNAVWDLWGKAERKPVWRLVADLTPEQFVDLIDFRYITDALTRDEALAILKANAPTKAERIAALERVGFPAYTTSAGWLGYPEDKVRRLTREAVAQGLSYIKIKVGRDLADDKKRCAIVREEIGPDRFLMIDANQIWDVGQAIAWVKELAPWKPLWIEEPTSPDDVLGHAAVRKAVKPLGIGVATGEACQNRVVFKQLMQAEAIDFCQIDSCRMGGVNEILSVILMAKKFGIPVCPHAGGVGLCEYVQHLAMIDYISVSATFEDPVLEYVDHLHEHFVDPVVIKNGRYMPPKLPGYSIEMKPKSLDAHEFSKGSVWRA
ncbi:L-fuconate dehydratase [Dongia sedimenti]|uniref:L-fuconate dehydratase n=1 Tax=Dongia sedimenti TaxID=3064282 RepID=A0ABU0YR32_9PROT|nr:L-fuconate dehydratase [Rhodospirillaceae bacterium R-7]